MELKFASPWAALIQVNDLRPSDGAGWPMDGQGATMADFVIETLGREQLAAVYPLVREAVPSLSLTSWLRFARPLTGSRRGTHCGIVTARRESRSFPCGLFCFRVDDDLALGRVLVADHFVAVDLLDPGAVLTALVEELDRLAHRLECKAVRSLVHGGIRDVADSLDAAGHRPEDASLLLKRLSRAPAGRPRAAAVA